MARKIVEEWVFYLNNFRVHAFTYDAYLMLLICPLEQHSERFIAHYQPFMKSFAAINISVKLRERVNEYAFFPNASKEDKFFLRLYSQKKEIKIKIKIKIS